MLVIQLAISLTFPPSCFPMLSGKTLLFANLSERLEIPFSSYQHNNKCWPRTIEQELKKKIGVGCLLKLIILGLEGRRPRWGQGFRLESRLRWRLRLKERWCRIDWIGEKKRERDSSAQVAEDFACMTNKWDLLSWLQSLNLNLQLASHKYSVSQLGTLCS